MGKQRSAVFDTAKFLAIYLVVFGHILKERTDSSAFLIDFVHMPLFFFISGYLAALSAERQSAGTVLKKKVKTLLIPYVFWSGISLLANTIPSVLRKTFKLDDMRTEAVEIFLYARSVWFLIQLFVTFLIFLAVRQVLQAAGGTKYSILAYAAVWLVLACFVPGKPFAFYKFKWLSPFFGLGGVVCKKRERLRQRFRMLERSSILFPVLAVIFFKECRFREYTDFAYQGMYSVLYGALYYIISAAGVVFLMTLAHWVSTCAAGRVCAEIGTYSMDIYVIHMFLIRLVPVSIDLHNMDICVYGVGALLSLAVILIIWFLCKAILRKIRLYRFVVGAGGFG